MKQDLISGASICCDRCGKKSTLANWAEYGVTWFIQTKLEGKKSVDICTSCTTSFIHHLIVFNVITVNTIINYAEVGNK